MKQVVRLEIDLLRLVQGALAQDGMTGAPRVLRRLTAEIESFASRLDKLCEVQPRVLDMPRAPYGRWRCSSCHAELTCADPAWRSTGERWEHHCADAGQAGHFPAERCPYTFGELKAVLDNLSPEQLAMPVLWWGDERGGLVHGCRLLDEDHVNPTGDGFEPISSYDAAWCAENDITQDDVREEGGCIAKGSPILEVD